MKILNTSQIRAADQFTIENEPIKSIDLMERASEAFVKKFLTLFNEKKTVSIFCGIGNNGGDGLAIGRILKEKGWDTFIYVLGITEKGSSDFLTNLKKITDYKLLEFSTDFPTFKEGELVIDGLFGSGLSRPINGPASELINYLNGQETKRISIDIASGLFADQPMPKSSTAFKPHHTISFQTPKLIFFLPDYYKYVGDWHVVDIGLDATFIESQSTPYHFTEKSELTHLIPKRSRFSHKSQVGKLLLVAGSKGKIGAAALCAKASLRSGVGLINVQVPKCGTAIMQTLVPEAMVIEDENAEFISSIAATNSTVGIGPGIGTSKETQKALTDFLATCDEPLVLDADAINILSLNPDLLSKLPKASILTPHPGEFRRLVGEWENDFEKLEKLRSLCRKHKLNIVLKGAYSAICDSMGSVYFNPSGNPGMATAGSGDVLTGIVASFLAQGIEPHKALLLGVYIHGLAGDLVAAEKGEHSLMASDIVSKISSAIRQHVS